MLQNWCAVLDLALAGPPVQIGMALGREFTMNALLTNHVWAYRARWRHVPTPFLTGGGGSQLGEDVSIVRFGGQIVTDFEKSGMAKECVKPLVLTFNMHEHL